MVSIILPTHNRPDVLRLAISSVLAQTYSNFEMIVVGDGCTDHTGDVVRAFKDPRIQWLDLPKSPGIGYKSRNEALKRVKGSRIAYLAHDDLWLHDHLELINARMDETGAEFVYSRALDISPEGMPWPFTFNLHIPILLKEFVDDRNMSIPLSTVMHARACLNKYGYWNEDILFGGDREFYRRIIIGGAQQNFAFEPTVTCLRFLAPWHKVKRRWWQINRKAIARRQRLIDIPHELRLDIGSFNTEQEAFWNAIQSDPSGWAGKLRRRASLVLDARLASIMDEVIPHVLGRIIRSLRAAIKLLGVPKDYAPDQTELLRKQRGMEI